MKEYNLFPSHKNPNFREEAQKTKDAILIHIKEKEDFVIQTTLGLLGIEKGSEELSASSWENLGLYFDESDEKYNLYLESDIQDNGDQASFLRIIIDEIIKSFILLRVQPQLKLHPGQVSLDRDDKYVYLRVKF